MSDLSSIRHRSKNILLTYPHFEMDKGKLIDQLWATVLEWEPQYLIVCRENHATGEPHMHCYIALNQTLQITKKNIHMFDIAKKVTKDDGTEEIKLFHCNIERIKSPKDAIRYVKKDGNYATKGICPWKDCATTAEKNKMLMNTDLMNLVQNGDISLFKVPQIKKALDILQNVKTSHTKKPVPKIYWFYGDTGSGKTKGAVEFAESFKKEYWISHGDDKWYDGYYGQEVAILDDIRASTWSFSNLLRLTDRYPYQVPIKGGYVWWLPKYIIITAPSRPEEVYKNHSTGEAWDGIEQLIRRITEKRIVAFPREEDDECKVPEDEATTEEISEDELTNRLFFFSTGLLNTLTTTVESTDKFDCYYHNANGDLIGVNKDEQIRITNEMAEEKQQEEKEGEESEKVPQTPK